MSTLFPKKLPAFAGLNTPGAGPHKRRAPLSTNVSDLPDDGPKTRSSWKRGGTPLSDPSTNNAVDQAATVFNFNFFLLLNLYQVDVELPL